MTTETREALTEALTRAGVPIGTLEQGNGHHTVTMPVGECMKAVGTGEPLGYQGIVARLEKQGLVLTGYGTKPGASLQEWCQYINFVPAADFEPRTDDLFDCIPF